MIQWGKAFKALTKLKTFSKASGVAGLFISTWEAFVRLVSTQDPIQFFVDIGVIFLDLDRQIYLAVEQLQTASTTEMIWLGLGIYGKIWLLSLILKLLAKPIKDTVISEDTPKIPVMMFYAFMFLMILTPLQVLGQVFSVLLETGTFTWEDMNPPWRGLLAVIFNIPTVLEPLYHMVVAIIEWLPWTEAELSNPENLTDENTTHIS